MQLDGKEIDTPWETKELAPILKVLTIDYLKKKGVPANE